MLRDFRSSYAAVMMACVVAAFSATPPVAAQERPPAPDAGVPALTRPIYDPDHLVAARRFLDATGGTDLVERVLSVFLPRVDASLRRQYPDIAENSAERFVALFKTAFREHHQIFRDANERIHADLLSREELEAGTAFYTSPAGRRFIEARPHIAASLAADEPGGRRDMKLSDVERHLSVADRRAYRAFTESPEGQRIAAAQPDIRLATAGFGARFGSLVSTIASAKALEQLKQEGDEP